MKEKEQKRKVLAAGVRLLDRADGLPLWLVLIPLMAVVFAPYRIMGEGSVFPFHDQLDESMMNMVLTARHLGEGASVLPEMMGGINASGLQPQAAAFVPLYAFLPAFAAFVIQYAVCFAAAFLGMYLCVKELVGSSILGAAAAGCFSLLPLYPIYGLSQMGIPLVFYAFLRLWKGKSPWISLALTAFFGLTSHLVYTGYVVLGFWAVGLLAAVYGRRKKTGWLACAFLLLLGIYVAENYSLFQEFLLGSGDFVSHREEMVNYALPFWDSVKDTFLFGGQHTSSWHKHLIVPILALLILGGICYKRLTGESRRLLVFAAAGFALLFGIAVFYGFCHWEPVTAWKNGRQGLMRYFQIDRIYWLYPAGWYLCFAVAAGVFWRQGRILALGKERSLLFVKLLSLCLLVPTADAIVDNSYFYMSVNQINNGSGVTGYISWESFYSEDLMQEIDERIGRDKQEYRVAHLGISPAPALMHGFYTIDGYSNNYPLEYKHSFRRAIAGELEKNEATRLYFDEWGNRCYLFNGATGNAWMLGKDRQIVYEKLEFDMEALKALGCQYILSCGEIRNAQELGMELLGYYETERSYWGIWLYEVKQ